MEISRTAVPVWVMPLTRVVESFAPEPGLFDVVIIDEASQSSVLELLAFYLGKRVVVVGDHEQVSPDAVGQRQEEVKHLIDEYLAGIPNYHLYDGLYSVYDVAMASFGGAICLREHFRCVPEIIQFSNYLSYQGQIKPLRDATGLQVVPHTIAHRVNGKLTGRKTNETEAMEIAALITAAIEQPEYENKTFGVISLVGDEQAYRIDEILRSKVSPAVYESRRIMCGNSAQFQGDERDVMFLSMVDASDDGPLSLRTQPMFQKRFNVAASRAKDQMWLVYSLNPDVDLKPDDLRRRLIAHAIDPLELTRRMEAAEVKAESEFERQVIRRLVSAGYRVRPQWRVGYYRIDMVVMGTRAKLAVECDGDRFHSLDRLQDDMLRQAILERLGWTFVRIRGSEFFRTPDTAIKGVFEAIERLEIEKLGNDGETVADSRRDTKLIDRLRVRAAELIRQWKLERDEQSNEDLEETANVAGGIRGPELFRSTSVSTPA
jgi:very-short-patch-repair endonuclease